MSLTPRSRRVRSIKAAIFVSLSVVFALDLVVPIGNAVGVPYVAVVLLTLWLPDRKSIFRTAALVTVMATIGFFSPTPEGPLFSLALKNRLIAMGVVWITAVWGNLLLKEQEATRKERDFNESLVETASSIILLLDTEARILYFNRSTTDCLGYRLGEVAGQDWFETCVPEPERQRARRSFRQSVEDGAARQSQFSVLTREGKVLQFSWSSKPMRDADLQVAQLLYVGQDITSLLEAQQRLVATERLAAIGQTIAAVSHETRNELHSLKLGLEMLSATLTDPNVQQILEHMQNSYARLHRLLEDVRHFAGPLHLERSAMPLNAVWQKAWSSLALARQERDVELQETLRCPHLQCSVDGLRIEQVFRNLFENAIAACSDPVWIEVSASTRLEDGKQFLQISVRDNGPGLSPEAKKKVFEPFFTTKQSGTGLGMAISKRILEAHGGDLSLGDHHGGGAQFILHLPLSESEKDPEPATQNSVSETENLTVN